MKTATLRELIQRLNEYAAENPGDLDKPTFFKIPCWQYNSNGPDQEAIVTESSSIAITSGEFMNEFHGGRLPTGESALVILLESGESIYSTPNGTWSGK